MKQSGACPKCAGRDLLVVAVIDQIDGDAIVGLAQDAWVCGACGYIEFYARDLDTVRRIARRTGTPGPPFR